MNTDKPSLVTLGLHGLSHFAQNHALPRFRVPQIADWIYRKYVTDPHEMKNLPLPVRTLLAEHLQCHTVQSIAQTVSPDGTQKHLLKLADGETIESVMIPAPERMTFCLSSQVGCPVRCAFCASGADGLIRHLSAGEILEQFFVLCRLHGKLPTNVVFMGIGEPLLNFNALSEVILLMTDPEAVGFSPRRITVSTSGVTKGIYQLAALDKPLYLALSLHAVDDTTRAKIIPDAFREPIAEILRACEAFTACHNRLVTLEYTLIDGINDSIAAAQKLAAIAFKLRAKVNIIPYNKVEGVAFSRPPQRMIDQFCNTVERGGANVTIRMSKGESADAACGQLRRARTDHISS